MAQSLGQQRALQEVVDTDRYPLHDPGGAVLAAVVERARAELRERGCTVLPDFIRPEQRATLRAEGEAVAPHAHYEPETVNAYNIAVDDTLPADHPARRAMVRGNAFVARDLLPRDCLIERLYTDPGFGRFVADCFELPALHPLADPLSALCLNVIPPGMAHPWHFDTNEYTVSMLTRESESGGQFHYCPGIRSAEAENLDDVRAVLDGDTTAVRELTLRPGDLQLFKGRFSLHRVDTVTGATARHSAIFAYSERPGVIGSVERTRQLFGRVLPAHHAAAAARVRGDALLD
ncbi:HalD/BesD family halogenase [Actinokineospora bangkokensis]|uniref:ArpA protein n=1 Tax=Actinokineospora bangkokensis TaxID=1193682 RepID=A0A1Q9LP60_9PSEU|nr:arpA protein [Actinokineospora bangkokensis]OLR93810.1 arpA protein [Actinokineospora bangkokensis]